MTEERYLGTDQCRVYQWLQFRCEDTNFLQRTVILPVPIAELCRLVSSGQVGLGSAPDWYETRDGGCYFRWDVADDLSVGGSANLGAARQGAGSDWSSLFLNANSA